MNSAHDFVSDPDDRAPIPQQPLASWYTHGTSDGLGDRLLMFDNTAAASLELLRFRAHIAASPGFERALRDRVERLVQFRHPAFSHARAVEYLDGDEGLALVSTYTPGKRLSEIFQGPQLREGIHPAFAVELIRQVTTALADLHGQGAGIAHGALAADRIVLAPDGRVVIVEHVLGSALEGLPLSVHQLWRELGIVALLDLSGTPRLDARSDIVQFGLVVLAVLIGRPVLTDEYPHQLGRLLDEFTENAGPRSPSLVPALRLWLIRALQLQDRGFESALEARDGLRQLPEAVGLGALDYFHTSRPRALWSLPTTSMSAPPRPSPAMLNPQIEREGHSEMPDVRITNYEMPAAWVLDEDVPAVAPRVARPVKELPPSVEDRAPVRDRLFTARNLAAALVVVCCVEAAAIGRLLMARPSVPTSAPAPMSAANVPVTIESLASGDVVMVDGHRAGVTPFALTVSPSTHAIRVLSSLVPPVVPAPTPPAPARGAETRAKAGVGPSARSVAEARVLSGGLRLSSSIELQVLEGERVLGSSTTGPIVLGAGVHELDFINNALGYRSRQMVEIAAGRITPLRVQPPDGRVSINALPWAQVWIDGSSVGETPLANVPLKVGEHEIVFRHPELGEQRMTTTVKSDALTRVSATLSR